MYLECRFRDPGWAERTCKEMAEFARRHRPELAACERSATFPKDVYQAFAANGWAGPITPVEEGGLGGGVAEYCLIEEEVARHGLVSPQIAVQGQRWLLQWGTPEQRARYLSGIASGRLVFAVCISEPGVGSSLKVMRSTARRRGGDWVLNGSKTHVNLGMASDVAIFYAMAEEGLTAFLVDMDQPGVTRRGTDPIGLRLLPTADIELHDVVVPDSARLGEAGGGLDTFLTTFNVSRLGNASELIGFGRRALADAVDYGAEREVADSVVTSFQGIQWTVADCYGLLYAASLARDRAATMADMGVEHALETTLAKKLAVDAAERACNEAFALVGGHGLYNDTDFGQLLHDTKVLRIAGGSLEILRNYIARRVLASEDYEGLR